MKTFFKPTFKSLKNRRFLTRFQSIFIFNLFCLLMIFLSSCGPKISDTKFLYNLPATFTYNEVNIEQAIKKQTKDMSFKEATIAKAYYEKEKDNDMVIKCGQRILAVGGDQEVMRRTTLQLAELFMQQGNYEKAEKYASDYQMLYPGSEETKQASFIAIKSNFLAAPSSDRDQTKTEKVIQLAQDFLEKYIDDKSYTDQVKKMLDDCYQKLIDKEICVINSYLNKYSYYKNEKTLGAAYKRLDYIKEKLSKFAKNQENKVKDIEIKLSKAKNKNIDTHYSFKRKWNTIKA